MCEKGWYFILNVYTKSFCPTVLILEVQEHYLLRILGTFTSWLCIDDLYINLFILLAIYV